MFIPQWQTQLLEDASRIRHRKGRMSISEIMTVVIGFHMSHHRDFKNNYTGYVSVFYKKAFPNLLSYTLFLEVMPRAIVSMCTYFTSLKGKFTGIEFIDSTNLNVYHYIRIHRHKTLMVSHKEEKAPWAGFMVSNYIWSSTIKVKLWQRRSRQAIFTTPNLSKILPRGLTDRLYGDNSYLCKALEANLFEKEVKLVTTVRKT